MRGTRFLVATAAAAALIVGAATVGGATSTADDTGDAEAGGQGFSRLFGALLTGSAEVPGPGDPDGAAAVVIRINLPAGRICVIGFDTNQIDEPTLFHIHEGDATVAGPVVVDFVPLLPSGLGCVQGGRQAGPGHRPEPGRLLLQRPQPGLHGRRGPGHARRRSSRPPTRQTTSPSVGRLR